MLVTHAEDAGWPAVWPAIQQDGALGQEIMEEVAHRAYAITPSVARRLTDKQIAELYVWLARQFPHAEDPEPETSGVVTARRSVVWLRNSILTELKERGTYESCEAIRRIGQELPALEWLKCTLMEAQNITRQKTWTPPAPADVLALAREKQARLVRTGDELLQVVLHSLRQLEEKLHGETPAAQFLWDGSRPKKENAFRDYVKLHLDDSLKQKGVICNREVLVRLGPQTDIHVDALQQEAPGKPYDKVTVIVEVKGCWHPELNSAMESQLLNRYLKSSQVQHGLYLVGWFNCDQWDAGDPRRKRAPRLAASQAQKKFDAQAAALSQEGIRIRAFVMDTALHS
ncbi:MAG: hypothetical protein AMJ46_14085 [Latescibacteria bacterium DG_63]|nr:MAG: hypothetical protein AMJ46_14085 [Latescibacteria bacterium DG_63]